MKPHDCTGPDCFGCRIKTVGFSAAAMPSRHPHAARTIETEKRWAKDHDAYRRLHRDGVTPAHIDGAATVETIANTRTQAEHLDCRPGWDA